MPSIATPYSGTDIASGVLLLLSLLLARVWRRDGEPGLGWLAAGLALIGLFYFMHDSTIPTDALVPRDLRFALPYAGVMLVVRGLIDYFAVPDRWKRRVTSVLLAPTAVALLLVLIAVAGIAAVPRRPPNLLLVSTLVGAGLLALWARRHEPGMGHAWVGAGLMASVLLPGLAMLLDPNTVALRYWGVLGQLLLGLSVLTVVVWRRRRALEIEVRRRCDAEARLQRAKDSLESEVLVRTAELRQLVSGLRSFNRNVSHDLRGPLGGIAGASSLARDALDRGDVALVRRMLDAVKVQASASAELVESLLQLAQVGDATMHQQPVNLQDVAQMVVEQVKCSATADRFPHVKIDAEVKAWADPALLRAVLTNLVNNAVKFSREDEQAHVDIAARVAGEEVEVTVADNGVGFDPACAEAMFEPFHRLHGADYEGHGVGLSIVRRAVERQGGRVWAEGEPQRGARFHFTLPTSR